MYYASPSPIVDFFEEIVNNLWLTISGELSTIVPAEKRDRLGMQIPPPDDTQAPKLTRAKVAIQIQALIRKWVFTGALSAGDRINEKHLSEKLGISRGPIREAIQALRQEGLVEVIPNRGAFLRKLTLKEVLDLYDVMAGLGFSAGRLLPLRISDAQLARLNRLHEKMVAAVADDAPLAFFKHNQAFHELLFKATKNRSLLEMMRDIEKRMLLYLHREATNTWMLRDSNQQHEEILTNLSQGDAEGTAKALMAHVLFGKQRIIDHWA
jgi:DNA-binding GntR family transcriptional regulator